jgi:hypothetical protein
MKLKKPWVLERGFNKLGSFKLMTLLNELPPHMGHEPLPRSSK